MRRRFAAPPVRSVRTEMPANFKAWSKAFLDGVIAPLEHDAVAMFETILGGAK
jgi:hypothetical protein